MEAIVKTGVPYTTRKKVNFIQCKQCPDIVFYIIDESINYEALQSIGSTTLQENYVKEKLGNVPAFSYKAHSAGNHSSVSNYILRLALNKSSYPDSQYHTITAPNIFSYAKAAGYKTIFYDAQSENNHLQNNMSQYDLDDIDQFITSDSVSKFFERDIIALQRLKPFVDNAEPNNKVAITLVKRGLHFPYLYNVPDHLANKIPEECKVTDSSFLSNPIFCKKKQYEIGLQFSVDMFMEQLFKLLKGKNFALIYTADHGQNLASAYLPHGSSENVSECEISVPVVIAGQAFASISQSTGVRSHFQIPPTLLRIFGFPAQADMPDLWSSWQGNADFLRSPFEKAWSTPVKNCVY